MLKVKKAMLFTVFSPAFLIIGICLLVSKIKQKHCSKYILANLNLDIIDKLSCEDFSHIVCLMLKSKRYKIYKKLCKSSNHNIIIAYKKKKKFLVNITNTSAQLNNIITDVVEKKKLFSCDCAFIVSNLSVSREILKNFQSKNIFLFERKFICNFLKNKKEEFKYNNFII